MSSASAAPDDRVVVPHRGSGFDLLIYTMYEKPGWQARTPATRTTVPHPGSAIDYEGRLYEVIQIGPGEGTRHTYRYALRKWEDRFVVRRAFPYTAHTQRAEVQRIREEQQRHQRHSLILYTFPLSTQLPSPIIQRWWREWGLPMNWMSQVSALMFGAPMLLLAMRFMARADLGEAGMKQVAVVCLYIGLEQTVRLLWVRFSGEPQGSLLLTGLWKLLHPFDERKRSRSQLLSPAMADEVRDLREQPWDAEVWTVFRDPVLLGSEPVNVEGFVYEPIGYIQQGIGLYRRYVFRLKRLPEGTEAVRHYCRERTPQVLNWLIQYERRRDFIHNWALLYGYLPAKDQLRYEKEYDFQCGVATRNTALAMLIVAGLKLLGLVGAKFDYSHLFGVYLAAESLYRFAIAETRGEPAGSLFGWLLRPFLPR